jgi:nucleotide-binding universal stress UspA family protein
MNANHLLIAIDDSEASERAVQYVAQIMRGNQDCQILLFHVGAPIPPRLLEHGGAEDPAVEERIEAALDEAQDEWTETAVQAEQSVFNRAQAILQQAHFPDYIVQTQIATPASRQRLETHILDAATTHGCGTIVVSREASSGLREWVQSHVADKLVQADHDHAIWVVAG